MWQFIRVVLVLADQECLDEDKLDLIRNFVRNGGGLIATEQTSLYTGRRLRKPDFGLKDLFGPVAIFGQCLRQKSVIVRIMHWRMQIAIQPENFHLLVIFVFVHTALRNFNTSGHCMRTIVPKRESEIIGHSMPIILLMDSTQEQ